MTFPTFRAEGDVPLTVGELIDVLGGFATDDVVIFCDVNQVSYCVVTRRPHEPSSAASEET